MLLPLLAGGILFLGNIQGQEISKRNCNIDPDLIFFENDELETLRNSFQFGGDCSPAIWKGEFNNVLLTHLRKRREMKADLSLHDHNILKDFAIYGTPLKPVNQLHNFALKSHRKRQIQVSGSFFSSNDQRRSQNQVGFFHPDSSRLPQNEDRPDIEFRPDIPRWPQFDERPFIFDDNQRRPQSYPKYSSRSNSIKSPDYQGNFFSPNNPRSPNTVRQSESSGLNDQTRPQNQDIFFPGFQRRPQSEVPDGRKRSQLDSLPSNFIMPDMRIPGDQGEVNNNYGNLNQLVIQRPQTTTRRPESTTLPGPPTWATPPSGCVRSCPNTPEYNPVCGTDRVTYINPGRLRCEKRCGKAIVNINHYGTCATTTTAEPTRTTAITPITSSTVRTIFNNIKT